MSLIPARSRIVWGGGAAPLLAALLSSSPQVPAYPLYGSEETGIRRLEEARLVQSGARRGRRQVAGGLLAVADVGPRLLAHPTLDLPAPDPDLSRRLVALLGDGADRYRVAVLDVTDPARPRYAEHRGGEPFSPSSVGKLAVAVGLFQALADAFPGDLGRRRTVLRETVVVADRLVRGDGHKVRFFDSAAGESAYRPLAVGDRGNLWEYLDWMLSASSNAAASMVIREAMLLVRLGPEYPPRPDAAARVFAGIPEGDLAALFSRAIERPLMRMGFGPRWFRQGSFFTRAGKALVPGGPSRVTVRALVEFLLRLEQGRVVDEFSSRELKRLLYVTERRIRYAASPALRPAAVYFKSGSLFTCAPEPGFRCERFRGNRLNQMTSAAIVESPAGRPRHRYLVGLTSNVLRRNSSLDHQVLATRIHRLMETAGGK